MIPKSGFRFSEKIMLKQEARALLHLDDAVGGKLLPEVDLLADRRRELLGRSTRGSNAIVRELVSGLAQRQRFVGGLVELIDDRARHPLRPNEAVPQVDLVTGHA